MTYIKIAGIEAESIVDGPGIRFVVFTQGCPHNCRGCHNPETHDFNRGESISSNDILNRVKANPLLDGITFSGGEPFLQAEKLARLGNDIKSLGLSIITYTGYSFEEILDKMDQNLGWEDLLNISDILIDGRYMESQRNLLLRFRGSSNQRIIDVQESLKMEEIISIDLDKLDSFSI